MKNELTRYFEMSKQMEYHASKIREFEENISSCREKYRENPVPVIKFIAHNFDDFDKEYYEDIFDLVYALFRMCPEQLSYLDGDDKVMHLKGKMEEIISTIS